MKGIVCFVAVSLLIFCACSNESREKEKTALEKEYSLDFDSENYEVKELTIDGRSIKFRAFENIVYVSKAIEPEYQSMNFYVPEAYYGGGQINGWTIETAPIFFPNKVGGYMPAKAGEVGKGFGREQAIDAIFTALEKGYVVASPGARGRSLEREGVYTGKAPAAIVDLKAAVRYLHYNDIKMAGDAGKIISNGTSAGGGLSVLLGTGGKGCEAYLEEIGAAKASEEIYAVSAYCPITILDKADMAYEWEFDGVYNYKMLRIKQSTDYQLERTWIEGEMTKERIGLSKKLAEMFPDYLNSLKLVDSEGKELSLQENGEGTFKEYLKNIIKASAQEELDKGTDLSEYEWIKVEGQRVQSIDFDGYVVHLGRMKISPAFDDVDLSSGENDLFGNSTIKARHFTEFSSEYSLVDGLMAEDEVIKIMNPMTYIGENNSDMAKYWRIRHGEKDSDTAIAISAILSAKLKMEGYNVDYKSPWAVPHSGDYDLDELFEWIDNISRIE